MWTPARRRKVPFIPQQSAMDCGAACLAMVLQYFGRIVPRDRLREILGAGRDGASAYQIFRAAQDQGLHVRAVRIELDDLEYLPPASILHWKFDHYVLFDRVTRDGSVIVDPAFGRRHVTRDQLGKSFTGIAMVFEPTEAFVPGGTATSFLGRYLSMILAERGLWWRILTVSLLLQLFGLGLPLLTGALVDRVIPRADRQLETVILAGLAAAIGFFFLTTYVRGQLLLRLRTLLDSKLTVAFFDHLVRLPFSFFLNRPTGDLLMRLSSLSTVRDLLTAGTLSGLLDGTLVVVYLAILLFAHPWMGVIALVAGTGQVLLTLRSRAQQKELISESLHIRARSQNMEIEILTGMETLKVLGGEQRALAKWSDLFVEYQNVELKRGQLSARYDAMISAIRLAAPLLLLSYGAHQVMIDQMSLGTMLGLQALAAGFFVPLASLAGTVVQLQALPGYLDRMEDVLRAAPEQDRSKVKPLEAFRGGVTLENVRYKYGPQAPYVLDGISVDIQPGQFVAIVGASGSGKSTLANLIAGLYDCEEGTIRFDGQDLRTLDLSSVRSQIGVVTQQPFLFGTTIRANIAMGDPGADMVRIVDAARRAHIQDDILAMPLKYDTQVLDRGAGLSGGQRQRLALARALLATPALLLLDEATSALDSLTEAAIASEVTALGCTRIVIAHRLSTVRRADLILVLEGGHIVEQGTHDALIARGGLYARLAGNPAEMV